MQLLVDICRGFSPEKRPVGEETRTVLSLYRENPSRKCKIQIFRVPRRQGDIHEFHNVTGSLCEFRNRNTENSRDHLDRLHSSHRPIGTERSITVSLDVAMLRRIAHIGLVPASRLDIWKTEPTCRIWRFLRHAVEHLQHLYAVHVP